ncbi:protein trichome birefringence-like 25 [Camellia sinensis]|uniref:protein trichome birefringence-like 25 n=1 Tax=Camellia sinensis TaxID=4442 RepID=UPI001036B032|nr:protein trichome birefringence-like 25 [Camellia sinensis]
MRFDLKTTNPFSFSSLANKRNHVFVKFVVCFLLLGLAFRLFLSTTSLQFSSDSTVNQTQISKNNVTAECDIFTGQWILDPSGPFYSNESCQDIEGHQNCMNNGRPDSKYLYWRWKPRNCELPKFDPQRFLDLMTNKSWAFIGDSISRNHVQSLLCSLSQAEQAVMVYHDKEYRSKKWHFRSHNFTLSVIWNPFLLKAAVFEDMNGVSSADIQLHLDKLDTLWTQQYNSFDYVIIAGGKWFLKTAVYYENNTIKGCHYCPGKNLTELGYDHAYRKALQLIFNFVTSSNHKAYVFFRTTTPDHFENGEWFSGGYCNRTGPFKEGEVDLSTVDTTMHNIELEEFEKAVAIGSEKGTTLKLLDTTHLSLLRPDGHPGPYRQFHPFAEGKNIKVQNDCLHWCLPGPIDSWNELVMKMLFSG